MLKKLGVRQPNMDTARSYFNANHISAISLSKITLGIGIAGINLAGNAKILYRKFVWVCLFTSDLQYVVYLSIGMLFGSAYKKINYYIDFLTASIIVTSLTILLFIFLVHFFIQQNNISGLKEEFRL